MRSKYDSLCVVDSVYSLFLFFLIKKGAIESTLFIISDAIPEDIAKNLPNSIFFPTFRKSRFSHIRRLAYCLGYKIFVKGRRVINYKDLEVFAQDHLFYSFVFLTKKYNLLEDGLGNYVIHKKSLSSRLRCILLGGKEWGDNLKASRVFLTGLSDIPSNLQKKVTLINIEEMWQELIDDDKYKILNIFGLNNDIVENKIDTVLLTQPFSEENVMTEKEKVDVYNSIMVNYPGSYFLKPHPREMTNYSAIMSNDVFVLPKSFPFQLLMLIKPPKRVVTCFSTVAYGSFNGQVKIHGTEFNEKLLNRYGRIKSNLDDR